jgi:hypothetical protein
VQARDTHAGTVCSLEQPMQVYLFAITGLPQHGGGRFLTDPLMRALHDAVSSHHNETTLLQAHHNIGSRMAYSIATIDCAWWYDVAVTKSCHPLIAYVRRPGRRPQTVCATQPLLPTWTTRHSLHHYSWSSPSQRPSAHFATHRFR